MQRRSSFQALGVLLVIAVAALTVLSISPPKPRPADAPPGEFSAVRARHYLDTIAAEPHPVGTAAHDKVKAYLLAELGALGLDIRVQEATAAVKAVGATRAARVANIIATKKGTAPGRAVLLAAHYDSVPESHGASDDGSGVATLLETARALNAGAPLKNDVVFLFSDGEELGMLGAVAFTRDELAREPIAVALNFEARGTAGAVALYDLSDPDGALVSAVKEVAPRVVSTSLLGTLARTLPNDSDASIFKRARIPTYAFAFVDHLYQYHHYTDDVDALDLGSLQHDGDYALPLVRALGDASLPLAEAPTVVYFDVLGRFVVSYGPVVAVVLSLATVVLALLFAREARRAGVLTARSGLAGAALALVALGVAALAGWVVQKALGAMVDPFLLFARPKLAALVGVAMGLAAMTALVGLAARRVTHGGLVVGALLLWAAVSAVLALVLPTASFAVEWSVLFAMAGAALWLRHRDSPSDWVDLGVASSLVPATFFWSTLAYTVFLMVGASAPSAVAVVAAAPLTLGVPFVAFVGPSRAMRAALVIFGTALVALAIGGLSLRSDTSVPRPDSLSYSLDLTRHSARWVTNHHESDSFTQQRVPEEKTWAAAPTFDVPPVELRETTIDEGDLSHKTIQVVSHGRVRCIKLWPEHEDPIEKVLFDGQAVLDIARFSAELDVKLARLIPHISIRSVATNYEYCGAGEAGFTLDLWMPKGKTVKLLVDTIRDGLPDPTLRPRGAGDGYPDIDSDKTVTTQEVTL
jgi:Peptidase family M28